MQGDEANKTEHWDVTDKEAAGSASSTSLLTIMSEN